LSYNSVNGSSVPPSSAGPGVTGLDLTRGSGINQNAGGTFNSNSWNGIDLASAQTANDFLQWGFTSTTAYDLTDFDIRYDRSGTGPNSLAIQASINGGSFQTIFTDTNVNEAGENNLDIDLSAFDNVTSATFRLFAWGARSSQGTFDIEDIGTGAGNGIRVFAEPSSGGGGNGPVVAIVATDDTAAENGSDSGTFNISRTGDTTAPLEVSYTVSGTATNGIDYIPNLTGTATIPAGSASVDITLTPVDDIVAEGPEAVTLTLVDTADYDLGAATAATVTINDNDVAFTKISTVQGTGLVSALVGQVVTVEAIVVGDFQRVGGTFNLRGFYVQEEDADADANPLTSEGLFIFDDLFGVDVQVGDKVQVTGTVAEFTSGSNSSLTQIRSVTDISVQSTGSVLPLPTEITFPVQNITDLEAFEGMRVTIPTTLTVTEHFQLGRFGQVVLSSDGATNQPGTDGRLDQYTQFNAPSVSGNSAYQAEIAKRRIVVDDGLTIQNPDPIVNARGGNPLSASNTLRGGDTVTGLSGILDDLFGDATVGQYRIQPVAPVDFQPTTPRPDETPDVGGRLKVASFNVLNYFNGDGLGGGFPTARGAETPEEFTRQRDKTISAILGLDADVVGLIEMENDGFGPNSALQDLVNGLNEVAGAGTYAFIDAGVPQVGTDVITVAFIYKPASVTPVGDVAILDKTVDFRFDSDNQRPTLAQTFEENATGALFTPVINHLKSKGSSAGNPGDEDAGDGQGLANGTRTRAAEALVDWLETNPTGVPDADYLVMGDLNAYAKEDPLTAIQNGADDAAGTSDDFTNLLPDSTYSFVFSGQWGALDHALASASLVDQVTGAAKWHINADEPTVLDYNTNFKSPRQIDSLYAPDAFRSSDHDPVVVGLNLVASPSVRLTFGQVLKQIEVEATQDGVSLGRVRGSQNGVVPNVDPFTIFALDSPDTGRRAGFIDRTWLDQGEGIGIADGDDGNSSSRKGIDGDEILGLAVTGFQTRDALVNVDRIASSDGAQIRVAGFKGNTLVDEEIFDLGVVSSGVIQTLTFNSTGFFDTLQISAADADTQFTFRSVELPTALAI
jgi:predicted extracellular nuclease